MPALNKDYNISKDPEMRGIGGSSSGAIAAFMVAWERPNEFRKVLSNVGSFVALLGYPLVLELNFSLREQAGLWAAAFLAMPLLVLGLPDEFTEHGDPIKVLARLGLDANGRFLALDIAMVADLGAYLSQNGPGSSVVAASTAHGGVYDIPGLTDVQWRTVETPWGRPSDQLMFGTLDGQQLVFLPRHGRGHRHSPTSINYRANIDALKRVNEMPETLPIRMFCGLPVSVAAVPMLDAVASASRYGLLNTSSGCGSSSNR